MLTNEPNPEKSPPKEPEASENVEKIESMFSPGFRSVAAMAGWDEESILVASLVVEDTPDRDFKQKKRSDLPFKTPPSNSRRKRRAHKRSPVLVAMPVLDLGEDETSRKENTNTDEERKAESEKKMIESKTNTDEEKKTGEKELTASSSTLPCMDRLREELSCAICLEICFEPSTTACGHSFCKKCLRTAAEKCGKRCPKCRQLISNGRSCTVNTVLWNTIQLLFPQEIETRKAAAKASNSRETDHKSPPPPRGISHYNVRNRNIQALNSPEDERLQSTRRVGNTYHEGRNHIMGPPGIASRGDEVNVRRRRRQVPGQDDDAALALRLQREEFMEVFRGSDDQYNGSVSLARENLRAMASRAMNIRIRGRPS
ncbi:hypothetical protein RHSIM_Rhsim10G0011600 [Rhododendron simsii]|uniref:RING-type E3 ubiquitin transferase n=1 Tax=Rhododendron simsii TaxID=118357 RepID=A0A834G9A4_RHOSS|nr:hypothetical protein RHSIM_Rhsim10G0011600 [Rhododendron simsii]